MKHKYPTVLDADSWAYPKALKENKGGGDGFDGDALSTALGWAGTVDYLNDVDNGEYGLVEELLEGIDESWVDEDTRAWSIKEGFRSAAFYASFTTLETLGIMNFGLREVKGFLNTKDKRAIATIIDAAFARSQAKKDKT